MFSKLIGALLVLVTIGCIVNPVLAKPTKMVTVPDRKNLSPRDLIDMKEISKYLENMSKEEIEKKYMEAVKKAKEQYEKAVKEQDELVRTIVKSERKLADNEINTVSVRSGYYHSDPTADGGTADHGGWGIGYSDAYINGNEIHVFSRAWIAGSYWATGRVWDEFTYNAPSHLCKVTINYHLRGVTAAIAANTDIKVYLRIYDHTLGYEVKKVPVFSYEVSGTWANYFDEDKTASTKVYLINGHKYTVELIVKVSSDAEGRAIGYSDFCDWQFNGQWRFVKWNYDVVEWV